MAGMDGNGGALNADPLRMFLQMRGELLRYARAIAADGDDVEDIVQEAWLRFSTIPPSRLIAEPRAFLFRIARNLTMDHHRRRRTERRLFVDDGDDATEAVPSEEPSAQARIESAHELASVRTAIDRLPDRTRQALLLHRVHGQTLVAIAARLGISKSLAQQLVVEGLERCRKARQTTI